MLTHNREQKVKEVQQSYVSLMKITKRYDDKTTKIKHEKSRAKLTGESIGAMGTKECIFYALPLWNLRTTYIKNQLECIITNT